MDVVIVCHTEFGYVKGKEVVYDKRAKEGVEVGVQRLLKIADGHGARVTFAVMPEAAERFPGNVKHEIGLHVHPGWQELSVHGNRYYVGDAYLRKHCKASSTSTVLKDYPYEEQLDMIKAGKEHIAETLGVEPKTFVAGRWSLNDDTVRALVEAGFTHDCSATPHKKRGHYDWSKLPRMCMPYRPSRSSYQAKGDLPLLMVPVSQALFGASVSPEIIPIIGRRWLESCFLEYYRQKLPLFHICLHSPCMTDPYFMGQMDALLRFIAAHDVSFKYASEVREAGGHRPRADVLPYILNIGGGMERPLAKLAIEGRR
ncbi:Alpha-amylase/alpha-mannosidase [Methanocella conradii HZ254]|uniref:Alpha-amylase/alpha-mannosidase n=1 Tax=Methanocella conradii (strain DSM 24694 / JCM 17849 / CGMCC 1.5162 / HZ254) TaxID=1041930 RepID=H8I5I6_METCZ|nr:PTS alpha-glucoside transporter subunit IIBC [Methanocella conradii]AFC99305.1 Alpha-amylase/alpha-mannosidase [Methanocella conradii HZ254]MDI6896915.1 PTS alpha-glucoside transporter subunit IIBC [Methanocella conradii]